MRAPKWMPPETPAAFFCLNQDKYIKHTREIYSLRIPSTLIYYPLDTAVHPSPMT
jgi:hypothetical protein